MFVCLCFFVIPKFPKSDRKALFDAAGLKEFKKKKKKSDLQPFLMKVSYSNCPVKGSCLRQRLKQ